MSAPGHLFPLCWESTGDQWWFASPIDWAAANGHYDVVRQLLHLDPNLLIKLTSLRRIRRLETVWDDHSQFQGAAICRAHIAKNLLIQSENKRGTKKSLIGAGYGGWLLYTAAAAGDTGFVSELLEREPLLVFGEGEYGVTDVLYAAARSKNSEVFRLLLNTSLKGVGGGRKQQQQQQQQQQREVGGMNGSRSSSSEFRWEMMNRAAHAAARGGNMEMMREIIAMECFHKKDVLAFRDAQGSTLLHSASARGQVEVVMDLVSSYGSINIVSSTDNHGNRALDVAAYRGHLPVVQALLPLLRTPSSQLQVSEYQNNYGDTFLHMAVAGFTTPGFRRVDYQMNLMKHLTTHLGNLLVAVINVRNNEGRTALHCAVALNIPCEVVHLLMSVPYINLNIRDHNGMTPFDLLLKQQQQQPSSNSEILIKRLISSNNSQLDHHFTRRALASHLRSQSFLLSQPHHQAHYVAGAGNSNSNSNRNSSSSRMLFMMRSPGASFRITDADILFYADDEDNHDNNDASNSSQLTFSGGELINNSCASGSIINPKSSSVNNAAMRLKILLRWPMKNKKKKKKNENENDKESNRPCSPDLSYCDGSSNSDNEESPKLGVEYPPTPLRQRFAKKQSSTIIPNNKG